MVEQLIRNEQVAGSNPVNGSIFVQVLFGKLEEIQADGFVEIAINLAVDDIDDHFTGSADNGAVEMSTEDAALVVAGTHMKMGIEFAIHSIDGAGQGNDLEIALEIVGIILLFVNFKDADGKIVGGTESADAGEFDIFGESNGFDLLKDFFATINPGDDSLIKTLVLHDSIIAERGDKSTASSLAGGWIWAGNDE